jgi:hypothetical protein
LSAAAIQALTIVSSRRPSSAIRQAKKQELKARKAVTA